ncbi:TMV resistance protein N-like [Castanea sativa]|uniref:TMV resistance protein N-like n=1 Tax=Castanea sativa TaxID=21020 RepID=UPI003F64ED62
MAFLTNEGAYSSSSTHQGTYDVFLSFRGEDIRYNFTCHLYKALCDNGLNTFIDYNLPRGEEISMELLKAIELSKISIVVFSENFAFSTWCLNELVKIFECRRKDRFDLPIFYKVSPSEIRKQDGKFGIALVEHEETFKNDIRKVHTWRKTLTEAANLSGFVYTDRCDAFELIRRVIKEILSFKLKCMPLFVAKFPVGIDFKVKAIESILDIESDDVRTLVIYGIGGVGKTTISKAVYNKIVIHFEGSCFLENVREISHTYNGIIRLQETLLSLINRSENFKVESITEGINLIKEKLHSKKVLLILDDVDETKLVENLLGECNWFASGSRVIITSRDKNILKTMQIDHSIYEVEKLNQFEARELFSHHAFRTSKPEEDYSKLVEQLIHYADGLPLAIAIIGADLYERSIHEWKSALERYENMLQPDIQEILKISYDGLEKNEKDIFLDIACFFKGYKMDDVVNILGACNLYSDHGIEILIDMCLITLEYGKLSMHDLLQQMGRGIVQQESKKIEQRSRIWCYEDAHELLTTNMASMRIRGIMLRSPEPIKVPLKAKVFKRMKNLKFLIGNVHIGKELEYVPLELRFLEWHVFPLSLSSKCSPLQNLVVLKMSSIILENVFKQGFQYANLKSINLSWCESITKLPDLCSPNLEELNLNSCLNLIEVHESIGSLDKLKVWNLNWCRQLQILPSRLMLKSLEKFILIYCSSLEKFPDIHPEMKCLKELNLLGSGIRELPSSLWYLTGLQKLILYNCDELRDFPTGANNSKIESKGLDLLETKFVSNLCLLMILFEFCSYLKNFALDLSRCVGIKIELDSWMQPDYFPVLTRLCLAYTRIVTIPDSISRFTRLVYLSISNCNKLREISRLAQSIRTVNAENCKWLDAQSSSRLWNQFGEILEILENRVTETTRSDVHYSHLLLPATEIPKRFKFNHQSVGNSISYFVGPKLSNLVVCIAFPSNEVGVNTCGEWSINISINGSKQTTLSENLMENIYDHLWLIYVQVNLLSPSEENHIEVEAIQNHIANSQNWMRLYVECTCCPQKPNISRHGCGSFSLIPDCTPLFPLRPTSPDYQWPVNNGEKDSGRVQSRCKRRRRKHRPTHGRKHYLSRFGWLQIRFRLWKRSSRPWRRRFTVGCDDRGSSSMPNNFVNDHTNTHLYQPSKKTRTS